MNKGEKKEEIPLQPVFLAMLAGITLVFLTQWVVNSLGGLAVGPFETVGFFEWVLFFLLLGFVFFLYLGPATFLIRFIILRFTGILAPFFRTALTFLASFVLVAFAFLLLGLGFSASGVSASELHGPWFYTIVVAYITLGSYLSALWFISENKSRNEEDPVDGSENKSRNEEDPVDGSENKSRNEEDPVDGE
jgi:hypothetical protein